MYPKLTKRISLLILLIITSVFTKAQVVANFTATPISGCAPLIVRFTDASAGSPTEWKWELGNGNISFLQNPSATYFLPGKYSVKLVAKNINSQDSVIKEEFIEVFEKPQVKFSASIESGCFPLPVNFKDSTVPGSGTIASWLWDFGDGSTSEEQNPSHIFNSARNFNITLQVKNSNGCVSLLTKPALIKINTGALAQFENDNPETCKAPVTINFQNQSTVTDDISYQWNFGDGNVSDQPSPAHAYTANGTYTVSLIAISSSGCRDTMVKENAVTVGLVEAGFNLPSVACQGASILFTNTSDPLPASVTWHYGDGSIGNTFNGTHNYTGFGNFQVKLIANFGACTDSVTKTINILPKPIAQFSATDTSDCKAPFAVTFTNTSTNGVLYSWDFGDNTSSTLQNPTHTYSGPGAYTVKLVVTGANGCRDSLIKTNYINISAPIARITNVPDSGCIPLTKNFSVSLNIPDPINSYTWNFGDGNTSTTPSPTHTYSTEGAYTVNVIVTTATGCADTVTINRAIVTNNKPTVSFSANPTIACAETRVSFTDLSTGGATRWLWDFGDNTTSTVRNPIHQYTDTGFFDIKLKVWKGGCMDSLLINDYIKINPPIAKFRINGTCANPFTKTFLNQSIGAEVSYWDFGDGNTSNAISPVHTYAAPGAYTVRLRVVNNTYGCEYTTTRTLRIINTTAQFTASDTAVCKGATVVFTTGLSNLDINTLNWNFGDSTPSRNSPSGSTSISHIYNNAGNFSVKLTVTDKNGCISTVTKTSYISVSGPTAKFSLSAPGTCLNSAITFNDSSTTDGNNAIQQWEWQYGDSSSEILTAPPFQHTYNIAGTYTVKLKVTDQRGCIDSFVSPATLRISNPKANFSSLDTFSCPNKPVNFVNQSSGPGLRYNWQFGDGGSSTAQNPSYSYASNGLYTVKLIITDRYGCIDSISRVNYISVTTPISLFSVSDTISNCPPLVVNFTNQSSGAESLKWDFGDSTYSTANDPIHFYNYPGVYFAKLTVTGIGGCTTTYQKKIVIKGPEGQFSYNPISGCNPVTVNFSASSNGRNSFVWDFADGNTIVSGDSVLSHTYTHPGRYIPKMILIDPSGCQVPIMGKDTILVSEITNNFSFNNKLLCDSGIVSFTDSSKIISGDSIVIYQWKFGDGGVSFDKNPVFQYTQPGIYYPQLITLSRQGCTDTVQSLIPVKVVASPKVNIVTTGSGCTPLTASFNAQLTTPDTSAIQWAWNFANGNTATGIAPAAQQFTTGVYAITLTGTNSSGCKGITIDSIEAYAIPTVSAGSDFILCNGSSQSIEASGAATYSWFPSTALSCINCATPTTSTINNITYIVRGTSQYGCSATDSVNITVKNKFTLTHSSNDSVCAGSSKKITARGAYSYVWTPATGLDNPTGSEPNASPAISTNYTVVGTDEVGCFKDTGYIFIKVNPVPTVEAGIDKTINVGSSIDLMPQISTDVTEVVWSPTTGVFRNAYPGVSVKPKENTEYSVEVKNRGGCAARDRVNVFVICNGSNIFMPNTFSPNADGANDVFYPRGTGLFKVRTLRIFTRWGEQVFERSNFDANNPSYGWDGTKKGQQLNADVFVYTLELVCDNGSVLTYHGNISLMK